MADLIITAPVKGWAAPLEEVPDPVFAERMMGDGVAIHPTGSTIHAPCDGLVAALHAAGHAVTIRNAAGAEILVHTGLDTVALKGKGFRALVAEGAEVLRGDPLIEFDLDAVGQAATSLITPVIVVNSDAFRIERRTIDKMVGVGEALMTLAPIAAEERDWAVGEGDTHRRTVTVPLVHGIHARPAARIGECARGFEAEVEIVAGDRRANVRSAVSLMGLGLKQSEQVVIEGRGRDAAQAVQAIGDMIASGMGERANAAPAPVPAAAAAAAPVAVPKGSLAGIGAVRGHVIGTSAWLRTETPEIARDAADPAAEIASLDTALARVRAHIGQAAGQGSDTQRQILEAHLAFLGDEELLAAARHHIAAGRSAGFGWSEAIGTQMAVLRGSGDARFAERAADLEDLQRQVLLALAGRDLTAQVFAPGTILLADDLLPSQLIGLDTAAIKGVVLAKGGPTSHVAIIAASIGLPMLVAVGAPLAAVAEGITVVLEIYPESALLRVDSSEEALARDREIIAANEERRAALLAHAGELCRTADGTRIEMFANIASVRDARLGVDCGAEGSGLLRTEFLFMDRAEAPDEEEQRAAYQAIASEMGDRPIIVRLLDIGGDKPAPWLPIDPEKNPMLGVRGIRATLANPELLDTQLRAILAVRPHGQCRIMVPMVTGLGELRAVRAALARIGGDPVQLGVMIETPAAAVTADLIAAEADFLSIGTNDLTQYVLAMDRENHALSGQIDAMHPAVLRLIAHTCEGGAKHKRVVGVCGGLASDAEGIPVLLGLGVTELSVSPSSVPQHKDLIRKLDLGRCRALAAQALDLGSAAEVRALARIFVEEFF